MLKYLKSVDMACNAYIYNDYIIIDVSSLIDYVFTWFNIAVIA